MIHQPASVHDLCFLGRDVTIWAFTTVCEGADIGEGAVIGANCWIGKNVRIGPRSRLQTGVFLPNDTVVGADVFIGPGVVMTDDKYPRVGNRHYAAMPPIIEDGASIGAGAVILPGVRIGRGAMVGAGAVVTRDVDAGITVIGLPARGAA